MPRSRKLSLFKLADGLVFYGYIKKENKSGWVVDVIKCEEINLFGEMSNVFVDRGAVEVLMTVLRGNKKRAGQE